MPVITRPRFHGSCEVTVREQEHEADARDVRAREAAELDAHQRDADGRGAVREHVAKREAAFGERWRLVHADEHGSHHGEDAIRIAAKYENRPAWM